MDSSAAIKQQIKHGIIAEQGAQDHHHQLDSSSSCYEVSGVGSSSVQLPTGPLNDLSSLLQQLPIKRGLSKHYNGKSRSFTSLSDVRCLEDLVKVEHPCNKKLKTCKSYAGLVGRQRSSRPSLTSSPVISKKLSNSRGSCSLLGAKRSDSFLGGRPPIPPHRSTSTSSISNQTALLA